MKCALVIGFVSKIVICCFWHQLKCGLVSTATRRSAICPALGRPLFLASSLAYYYSRAFPAKKNTRRPNLLCSFFVITLCDSCLCLLLEFKSELIHWDVCVCEELQSFEIVNLLKTLTSVACIGRLSFIRLFKFDHATCLSPHLFRNSLTIWTRSFISQTRLLTCWPPWKRSPVLSVFILWEVCLNWIFETT